MGKTEKAMTIDEVAITQEELDSMSPLGREIAQGLLEALAYVRGEDVEVRITTISIPDPAPVYGASEVKATRARWKMTQANFARLMNISPKTVEAWEAGTKKPGSAARRLLQIASDSEASRALAQVAGIGAESPLALSSTEAPQAAVSPAQPTKAKTSRGASRGKTAPQPSKSL